MFKDAQIGKLRVEIGDDKRIAEAVATACLTAFNRLLHCRAQHDVMQRARKRREGRQPVRSHDAIEDDEITCLGVATATSAAICMIIRFC